MLAFKIIITQLMIMFLTLLVSLIGNAADNNDVERVAYILVMIEVFVLILSLIIALWLI